MTTHDTPATFRTRVNLVQVPVVVRDREGHAVGNLRKEDFQVFDQGKPQAITNFTVDKSGGQTPSAEATPSGTTTAPAAPATDAPPAESQTAAMPDRFVAYLFDDVHLVLTDLMQVRNAAERHLNDSLTPTDRVGIFTTSGRTTLDFTDDRAKVHETLLRLRPQPIARSTSSECPDIDYYQADLIFNKNDPTALQAATLEAILCMSLDPTDPSSTQQAQSMSRTTASRVINEGDAETRISLTTIRDAVRRISTMPGKRSIILISPGFLTLFDIQQEKTEIIDRAIRANVIISSLNARGLFTVVPGGDASQQGPQSPIAAAMKSQYLTASVLAEEDVLGELAYGTGGAFFHNNNDLVEGFKRVAARPEYVYVLGFSPQNLKLDGRFHSLKVTLQNGNKLNLQARRGYYAPKHMADPEETAKEEIQDALFSREELRDIPVELHTQFFKASESSAQLAVLVRVDVRRLKFRKENGRNCDDLAVVSALFDRNGNLVTGTNKNIEMRLRDQTLDRLGSGITVKSNFDVKPGSYVIRLVVRDSEGQLMAAANGAVEIP
jgi:VWFA-related protein